MRSITPLFVLLLSSRSLAQSTTIIDNATIVSGVDPSDVAAIPEPDVLGPPIGVAEVVPTITFDAASVTASILALVTAATDAQISILDSAAPTSVVAQEDRRKRSFIGASMPLHPQTMVYTSATPSTALSEGTARKRAFVRGSTNLRRRDIKYPIDTSSFTVPNGYTPAFINLQGATQARGYLTYKTLKTYDPTQCTAACDKIKTCVFANIYYEKDPDASNNPVDVIKCSLYSMFQTSATATNKGQWRDSFQILVTGSNGYNKASTPVAPTGYSLQSLPAGVNAPILDSQGQGRLIQPVYLSYYSADLCAAACDKQTQYDKSQAPDNCNYKSCVYANLYVLSKDGAPQTVVCALYTENTDSSAATNYGYTNDDGVYQVSNSIALLNTGLIQAGYPLSCKASSDEIAKLQSQGGAFCSSYLGYSPSVTTTTTTQTPPPVTVQSTVTEITTQSTTTTVLYKRAAVPTPSFIIGWPSTKISAACSQVATGISSSTTVTTAATPYVTKPAITLSSTIVAVSTVSSSSKLPPRSFRPCTGPVFGNNAGRGAGGCPSQCFCDHGVDGTGFCEDSVNCGARCVSDSDCPSTQKCTDSYFVECGGSTCLDSVNCLA